MNLLCPACHEPLPAAAGAVLACPRCAAEVDVSRAGTAAGRPRFVPEIDRTGDEVGGYRLEGRLGSGGMGTVYRGRGPDGLVAVKFLSPAFAGDPALVVRFSREIEALRRLDHPAIVRVRAHGAAGGVPWFAMELVDGNDLRTRLGRGPLPPDELLRIFQALLGALGHAHERGVVHRDLKPANVLLAPDGARLADFGIARIDASALHGPGAATRLTETAAMIGTLPYMAPEQKAGGVVDARSDLFAIGVMLYEAATGALPEGAFPPPSAVVSAYGARFDRVVLRLLRPDPASRFPSSASAAAALATALRPRSTRRVALAAAVALAGGAATAVMGLGPQRTSPPAATPRFASRSTGTGASPAAPSKASSPASGSGPVAAATATPPDAGPRVSPTSSSTASTSPPADLPLPLTKNIESLAGKSKASQKSGSQPAKVAPARPSPKGKSRKLEANPKNFP